jgi:flagellar protein FliO/FliZ
MPALADAWPALALLALLLCLPWLVRRLRGAGWAGLKPVEQPARVVAVLPLGTQQRVVTIEVQQGSQTKRLLIGVTPQSCTVLDAWHIPTPSSQQPNQPDA